jgi:hypothetical protein
MLAALENTQVKKEIMNDEKEEVLKTIYRKIYPKRIDYLQGNKYYSDELPNNIDTCADITINHRTARLEDLERVAERKKCT